MKLNFKQWYESIFGGGGTQEPEPASIVPMLINKIQNQAFPSYDADPTDPLLAIIKKKCSRRRRL